MRTLQWVEYTNNIFHLKWIEHEMLNKDAEEVSRVPLILYVELYSSPPLTSPR